MIAIDLVLHPPDMKVRDEDNIYKGLYDSITHAGIWIDDSQVREKHVTYGPVVKGSGRVRLHIYEKPWREFDVVPKCCRD